MIKFSHAWPTKLLLMNSREQKLSKIRNPSLDMNFMFSLQIFKHSELQLKNYLDATLSHLPLVVLRKKGINLITCFQS